MADTIKDFMVSLGFTGDEGGAKKVVDLARKTEDAVTKAAEAGSDKRVEAEQSASTERIGIIKALGKIFVAMEQDRADKAERIRKDEAAKDEKLQQERAKKEAERRAKAIKDLRTHATQMAVFAIKAVTAVEATALGIVAATDRAAKSFERLNYAAQRTGAAPGKLTAFDYAVEQTGGDAAGAQASLENFGAKMRINGTAYARQLKAMGIETRGANGQMRDSADILTDLGQKLAEIQKRGPTGYGNALGFASMFGIDERTMLAIENPQFSRRFRERQAIDAKTGADQGAAAQAGTAFEQSMRKLEAMADSIRTKVSTNLFVTLTPELDKLAKWAEEHGDQISNVIDRVVKDILALAKAVADDLGHVPWDKVLTDVENFGKEFDKKTKDLFGESGPVIATLALFGLAVSSKVLGPLNLVLATLNAIGKVPLVGRLLGSTVAAVALGASAESTPGAGIPADPAARAKVAEENKRLTDEANAKAGQGNGFWSDTWAYLKSKVGLGTEDPDSRKVKDAIQAIADNTKKMADNAGVGDGVGGVTTSSGGLGGSGQHIGGGSSPGASLMDHAGPSRPAKGALAANQKEAYAAALKEGLSPTAARALVANMSGEGLAVPRDYHWDGTHMASGIVQWDPTRSAAIKAKFGALPHQLSVADQTRAAIWEMKTNPAYARTWQALQGNDANAMIDALVRNYENPRDKNGAISTRLGYLKGFNPGAPSAMAPAPAGTSAAAISDAEVFAARQRLAAGGRDPKDQALVKRYMEQQNAPKAGADKHADAIVHQARRIADANIEQLGRAQRTLAAHLGSAATGLPYVYPHHMISVATRHAIDNSRRSVAMTHNPTFNINGGDTRTAMAEAHRLAGRGQADMVRNMSVMEA